MKILFFHRWVGVHGGGTETHIKELALLLAKRGHEVNILTREGKELKNFPSIIKIHRISKNWRESDHSYNDYRAYCHTGLFMLKSFLKLLSLRIFNEIKYDIISVHFVTEGEVARMYRMMFGTPYVFVLEGYTPLEGKRAKLANAQIAISLHEKNECELNHRYSPIYIPKGLDTRFNLNADGDDIRKKFAVNGEKLILTVARIEPRKDYPTLIEAAKIVLSKNKSVKFLIAGDGIDFEKIKALIRKEKLENFVIMLGQIDYTSEHFPKIYRGSDLFVLPTLYEGFGYVYLEAMACGIPIISTKVGAVPEVVGDAGIIIEPKNPKLLADKILEVLENETLRNELSRKGLERVKNFDWNSKIAEYEKVYESVLS